jgi:hypothetical protein
LEVNRDSGIGAEAVPINHQLFEGARGEGGLFLPHPLLKGLT